MNASRTFAVGAAVLGVLVLALVASFTFRDQAQVAASPSPTASPTPSPSATPSATTTASPSVAANATPTSPATTGRYVSPLGYSIETPPPWHLSTCIENVQGVERDGEHFVPVPARDETASDLGPQYPTLTVLSAANPENLTPRQWIAQRKEPIVFTDAGEFEDVTYAGRPAVRKGVRETPGVYQHMVTSGGRMYFVLPEIRRPLDASLSSSLVRMIGSLQFISEAERAAARAALPPAPPPRTPEQVADGLAAAFRANDINALIALSAPCMFRFGEQAGGTNWSKEKYFEDLRAMFASGVTVTVQPRPITIEREFNRWVASTWQDARGSQLRRMILRRGPNENWRWAGTIERYQ